MLIVCVGVTTALNIAKICFEPPRFSLPIRETIGYVFFSNNANRHVLVISSSSSASASAANSSGVFFLRIKGLGSSWVISCTSSRFFMLYCNENKKPRGEWIKEGILLLVYTRFYAVEEVDEEFPAKFLFILSSKAAGYLWDGMSTRYIYFSYNFNKFQ